TGLAKGHPENQMSASEIARKFQDCVKHSSKPVPRRKIEQLLATVNGLEKVDQVSRLTELLA
ncbi:MAG: hypothetical protein Q7R57_01650, partial [Dehalococcoidales bacterium]|nr:hypothetical protein [Dehalococcoidales bacterium]